MSIKYAILAAVSSKPRTGYDLGKKIEGSIGFFWNATHQQIYKELKDLESLGWLNYQIVHQSDKPDKKLYRMTRNGLKELKQWIALSAELPPAKDELLIKIFAGHLVDPGILIHVLEDQRLKRVVRLKKYRETENEHFKDVKSLSDEYQFQYLTLRRGIVFEEAWLVWAKETLDFLNLRVK